MTSLLCLAGCGGGHDSPTPPSTTSSSGQAQVYIALGDSFASGTGTSDIYGEKCQRSRRAYPWLVERAIGASTFTNQSCAGTTSSEILVGQADVLTSDVTLVTITTGGNDVEALQYVADCASSGETECRLAKIEISERIARQLGPRIDAAFSLVRSRAPSARVLVTGYPRLFAERRCEAAGGLGVAEQRLVNELTGELNARIRQTALGAGVEYVGVERRFASHGVCSRAPWINGVDVRRGALHPTDRGHRLGYLPAILAALDRSRS